MCCGHLEGGFTEEIETLTSPKELMKLRKSMRTPVDKIADSNTSLSSSNMRLSSGFFLIFYSLHFLHWVAVMPSYGSFNIRNG